MYSTLNEFRTKCYSTSITKLRCVIEPRLLVISEQVTSLVDR